MERPWREEVQLLFGQLAVAVTRFLILLVFMGMHWVLTQVTEAVLTETWAKAKRALEAIFFSGFTLLYADQVFEMMAIFIPRVQGLRNWLFRGNTSTGASL